MPVKIARSAPRPSFGLPELLVAIQPRASLAAKLEKRKYCAMSCGLFGTLRSGDYCALLAYLERNNRYRNALRAIIRILLHDSRQIAGSPRSGAPFNEALA